LICRSPHREIRLVPTISIPRTGVWKVEGRFATGVDRGWVTIQIQGKPQGKPLSLESAADGIGSFEPLGEVMLSAGAAEVQILFTTSDSKKPSFAGLDALRMTRVSTPIAARP
jgi:hypothetical protein